MEVCALNISLLKKVFLSLVFVYLPRTFIARWGLWTLLLTRLAPRVSQQRSWGHWRKHSQALPLLWGLRSSLNVKRQVQNLSWHPCLSSSSNRCYFLNSGFTFPPPYLPLPRVQLALSLCALQLVLSVSCMPLQEQEIGSQNWWHQLQPCHCLLFVYCNNSLSRSVSKKYL